MNLPSPSSALATASRLCDQRGQKLTELRRRVLEIIVHSRKPLGAYAILDVLRAEGRNGAPPTVYRALEFLLEQGLIHRLASLNAYIGCTHPHERHSSQFLICKHCGTVGELISTRLESDIAAAAQAQGFTAEATIVEVLGRCAACREPS